jgi:hypothetical protein
MSHLRDMMHGCAAILIGLVRSSEALQQFFRCNGATKGWFLAAIILWLCSAVGGHNSKTTSWTLSRPEAKKSGFLRDLV